VFRNRFIVVPVPALEIGGLLGFPAPQGRREKNGGRDWDRTSDPCDVNGQALNETR
jgi:hypothetical protein